LKGREIGLKKRILGKRTETWWAKETKKTGGGTGALMPKAELTGEKIALKTSEGRRKAAAINAGRKRTHQGENQKNKEDDELFAVINMTKMEGKNIREKENKNRGQG